MTVVTAVPLDPTEIGETASTEPVPVEWWYANALLDAPGTPVDGLMLVTIFSKFSGVIEEGRHLLISPDGGVFADFGTGPLPVDTIQGSTEVLDVRNAPSYLRGGYPNYELHVEGQADSGAHISATLSYEATAAPEHEGYINSQLKHYVVYRLNAIGTIGIGDRTYPVRGVGYYEHMTGTLGWLEPFLGSLTLPVFTNGWNWYWSPAAGPDKLIVQAGSLVTEGDPVPWASISVDGKSFAHFTSGAFEVLETRTFEGVDHAHKFRVVDQTEAGSIDLVFTRRDASQRMRKEIPAGSSVVFVTGFAELTGTVTLDGKVYDVDGGPAFGSAFTVNLSRPLSAFRRLPNIVRVPLGRVIGLLRRVFSRGR